jgi:hypothetical protein
MSSRIIEFQITRVSSYLAVIWGIYFIFGEIYLTGPNSCHKVHIKEVGLAKTLLR